MSAQTVTGPVPASELGFTLPHEHVLFGYPGYQGDLTLGPFDREAALNACADVARSLLSRGVRTLVDATPNECGRDPAFLRDLSERSGLRILCSSGYYYEGEGATTYFKFRASLGGGEAEIEELMRHEVTVGIGASGVRAGVIKLARSRDAITPYEQMFFRAAARVQRDTGVPIITHTQEGRQGPQQAQLLLSHGVSIAFDRLGLQGLVGTPTDAQRLDVLTTLLGEGFADRILLSHDSIWQWLGRPIPMPDAILGAVKDWHPLHLTDDILPELNRRGVSAGQVQQMTVGNPARLFG
ncbi:phosphotriesterase [Deinococcus sp. A31D244]|uniref:phosphotriesterase family protein n=1 Tax=Deinococcus sp. A31D244 TaxID=3397675 RepID=UPI0039E1ACB3